MRGRCEIIEAPARRPDRTTTTGLCAAVIWIALAYGVPANEAAPEAANCSLESGPIHTVARILDGETVMLDDGSEVRLIGALAPRAGDAGAARGTWPAEAYAIRTLTELVLGRTVKLSYGGLRKDRYGRHLAHLFLNQATGDTWVQGQLLAAGAARAYGLPGSFACGPELFAHERVARQARRGLWDTAIYRAKPAHLTALLMSRRSRFEIVEGIVANVTRTKSGLYLGFGSDWKSDFTARVAKDVLASHPELDHMLSSIAGKQISVRGWIERRNGPMIDVRDPSQIDLQQPNDRPAGPAISRLPDPSAAEPARTPPADADSNAPEQPGKDNRPAAPLGKPPGDVDL